MLYVFDQQKKMLIMVDSTPVEKWCKDTLVLIYVSQTLGFNLRYMATVNVHSHGWNENFFK